jgi:branched-chain amino acid transport system permease protein
MYAPSGLTGLVMMHGPACQAGRLDRLAVPYLKALFPLLAFVIGIIALLEMSHHQNASGTAAAVWGVFGYEIALASPAPWLVALALLITGFLGLRRCLPELREAWDAANAPEARS